MTRCAATLLAVLTCSSMVEAQFLPPPGVNRPGGSMPIGNAPAGNLPGANMPAGSMPGGNMPRANVPGSNMPGLGDPGANQPDFGNHGAPNIPDFGGMSMFENVFKCSHCNKEVGRGAVQPDIAKCPHCGVVFNNTASGQKAASEWSWQRVNIRGVGKMIGLVIAGLAIVGGLVVGAVKFLGGAFTQKKKPLKKRRRNWDEED